MANNWDGSKQRERIEELRKKIKIAEDMKRKKIKITEDMNKIKALEKKLADETEARKKLREKNKRIIK